MIKQIKINKFRRLENVEENNIGKVNELYGSNESGKTSFLNFILWVLIGETLDFGVSDDENLDETNYYQYIGGEIKCVDKENKTWIFGRNYGYDEDNGKKTNDFFVNGRKVKNQIEYFNSIQECFNLKINLNKIKGFSLLKALTDVYYLGKSENETQFRELINQLLNIDTDTILLEKEKYENIKNDYLDNFNDYEKTKEYYNQKIKENTKNLDSVKSQIEEDKKYSFDNKEFEELFEKIKSHNYTYISELNVEDKVNELRDLEIEYAVSVNKDKENALNFKEKKDLEELKVKFNKKVEEYNKCAFLNNQNNHLIEIANLKLNDLKKNLIDINKEKFEEIVCPNCNEIVNKSGLEQFNKNKNAKIKSLNASIDASKKELEMYKSKLYDLKDKKEELDTTLDNIKALESAVESILSNGGVNLSSDTTKALESKINSLKNDIQDLVAKDNELQEKFYQEKQAEMDILVKRFKELEENKKHYDRLVINKENKSILIDNKSTFELKKGLLEEFKKEEISIINKETKKIFGDDFEFVMLEKNKVNDNYKKVCFAKVDGVKYSKKNTAQALLLGIILMEKIKAYIGGCDLPIMFDIIDNIGESIREKIFNITTSQIFYTRIETKDNVKRELKVIKE